MKKCPNCGARIYSNDYRCQYCGSETDRTSTSLKQQPDHLFKENNSANKQFSNIVDDGSIIWGIIGFIFPIIGFIIYIVWNKTKPKNAQKAGLGALIGFIAQVIGLTTIPFFSFFNIFRRFPY